MSRILVVDDSVFARFNICNILKKAGHEIAEAANGQEALAMIGSFQPDCVFSDLLMPELDGVGFLAAINERRLRLPVVVLTADIQESKKQQCFDLGAAAFLSKPPQKTELLRVLDRILNQEAAK